MWSTVFRLEMVCKHLIQNKNAQTDSKFQSVWEGWDKPSLIHSIRPVTMDQTETETNKICTCAMKQKWRNDVWCTEQADVADEYNKRLSFHFKIEKWWGTKLFHKCLLRTLIRKCLVLRTGMDYFTAWLIKASLCKTSCACHLLIRTRNRQILSLLFKTQLVTDNCAHQPVHFI